jgi:hypothetical protein
MYGRKTEEGWRKDGGRRRAGGERGMRIGIDSSAERSAIGVEDGKVRWNETRRLGLRIVGQIDKVESEGGDRPGRRKRRRKRRRAVAARSAPSYSQQPWLLLNLMSKEKRGRLTMVGQTF